MAFSLTHTFVSAIPDGSDATVVRPSNWNANHTITGQVPVANGGTGVAVSTGSVAVVLSTSPTLVTPVLGVATATSLAIGGATIGTNALAVTGTTTLSGNVLFSPDATYSIGASGATRPDAVYAATLVRASFLTNNTGASIGSSADSSWNFGNNGGTQSFSLTAPAVTATPVLQLGRADAAAPVAQTLQVQSVVAGTTNTAGTDWSFYGSKGTGTGAGGSLKFYTSPAGSTGSAQNAGVLRLELNGIGNAAFYGQVQATSGGGGFVAPSTGAYFFNASTEIRNVSDGVVDLKNAAGTNSVRFTVGASNLLTLNGGLNLGSALTLPGASVAQWSGRFVFSTPSDGVLSLQNAGQTNTVLLTVASLNRLAFNGPTKDLTTVVASLPSAATSGAGYKAFVTDANTTVILGLGLTVVGGGSNNVPVYSDGTNWIVG